MGGSGSRVSPSLMSSPTVSEGSSWPCTQGCSEPFSTVGLPVPSVRLEVSEPTPNRLDRTAFSVVPLDRQGDDGAYWATSTSEERMSALEYLRRMA